mgnify:CR=1 FL=1
MFGLLASGLSQTLTGQPELRILHTWLLFLWLALTVLILPALACDLGKEEPLWTPETPRQYTAEVQPASEVYVLTDEDEGALLRILAVDD